MFEKGNGIQLCVSFIKILFRKQDLVYFTGKPVSGYIRRNPSTAHASNKQKYNLIVFNDNVQMNQFDHNVFTCHRFSAC